MNSLMSGPVLIIHCNLEVSTKVHLHSQLPVITHTTPQQLCYLRRQRGGTCIKIYAAPSESAAAAARGLAGPAGPPGATARMTPGPERPGGRDPAGRGTGRRRRVRAGPTRKCPGRARRERSRALAAPAGNDHITPKRRGLRLKGACALRLRSPKERRRP